MRGFSLLQFNVEIHRNGLQVIFPFKSLLLLLKVAFDFVPRVADNILESAICMLFLYIDVTIQECPQATYDSRTPAWLTD